MLKPYCLKYFVLGQWVFYIWSRKIQILNIYICLNKLRLIKYITIQLHWSGEKQYRGINKTYNLKQEILSLEKKRKTYVHNPFHLWWSVIDYTILTLIEMIISLKFFAVTRIFIINHITQNIS